jgi:outer membrane protein
MCVSRLVEPARVVAIALVAALAVPSPGLAQQPAPMVSLPAAPLTLDQVLEMAVARSEGVGIAQAGIQRAGGEQVRARSGLFPQLSLSGGYDRALASEFSGIFDNVDVGGGGDSGDGTDDGLADLPFGRANTWRLSLSLSQNLYSGGRLGLQQRLATLGSEAATHGLTTARGQVLFDVTQAYYDAALADRLVGIAEATVQQAGATLQQTEAGFQAGTQAEFEVLRARVNRDNQQPPLIRQRVNRDLALLRLKQMLDLPADADLRLADSLGDELLPPPPVFAARVASVERSLGTSAATFTAVQSGAAPARTVVAEAETTVRLRESSLQLTEAARKPSVTLNSTYTRLAYPSNGIPTFDRTNWSVGASVQLPILTGGRQRGDEIVAKADVDDARLRLQQVQELADVDTRSAWAELLAARAAWEASAGTVQQAARAYELADVRFRNGVSTQLELSDARLLLQQAEVNRAQAARDLQVARARVALLPDLPLGTAGAGAATQRPTQQQAVPQTPVQQPQGSTPITNAAAQTQGTTGTR